MGVVYKIYQHKISRHPSATKPIEYEAWWAVNVYRKKNLQVAHLVATVSTRVSPQTKIYGTKFARDLISLLEMRINKL